MSTGHKDCFPLLSLPLDVIGRILNKLDARTMVNVELTSRFFRVRHPSSLLRIMEQAAEKIYEARHGPEEQISLQNPTWKTLSSERASVGFDTELGERKGFTFVRSTDSTCLSQVKLIGLGPRLLVSDLSTSQQPRLRWRLRVKGNTAVEFGIIPVKWQKRKKALHKCLTEEAPCVGFYSSITVGSQLPFQCPVVRGSIVEISIENGKANFLVLNPADSWDVRWENDKRAYTPYRGPREIRFSQDFPPELDVKLALTAWRKAEFDVLHIAYFKATSLSKQE